MRLTRKSTGALIILLTFCASAARADLRSYDLTLIGETGAPTSRVRVHSYELGSTYRVSAEPVRSNKINLAQAADVNKAFPFVVSAGGFGDESLPHGLISVREDFLSRLALAETMPTLLCFNSSGFEIRRVSADIGKTLRRIALDCLAAIQAPELLIEKGRNLRPSQRPTLWKHVLVARSAKGDRVVVVEGMASPSALAEFLGPNARPCPRLVGKTTLQRVMVRMSPSQAASVSCSLGLTDVAILNSGRATGTVHYGIRVQGEAASSPPVAMLFDD